MATITKRFLSGSTDGAAIGISASSTPGTTIHTGVTGTTDIDIVHLWAVSPSVLTLTIELAGTAANVTVVLAADTPTKVLDGVPINNAKTVAGFRAGGTVHVWGYVNRITA